MREELLKESKFRIEIKTPDGKININEKDLSYGAAMSLCEHILEEHKDDDILQERMTTCMESFGFCGFGGSGYSITISAYKPVIKTDEKQVCPSRSQNSGPWNYGDGEDYWEIRGEDKCCSYCGSLHPDRVIELVKEQGWEIVEFTTKRYKCYVNRKNIPNASFGGIKYYRWHDTKELLDEIRKEFIDKKEDNEKK